MPAVLVKTYFIDSEDDMKRFDVNKCAVAITKGILSTLGITYLAIKNGWKKDSGKWYYYKNGKTFTNEWIYDTDKKWYYLGADGVMFIGLQKISNQTYLFKSSGALSVGKFTLQFETIPIEGVEEYKLESGIGELEVLKGLNGDGYIPSQYPTLLQQWLYQMYTLEDIAVDTLTDAQDSVTTATE
ncbi:MAG: hypothetical protein K0R90_600 [Oscillospiraceae bacterium]|nr:hypothetical protein [Oscillospiraceae bacterium]